MSTPANAINVSTAGLVKFDGTNTFSTTTITQHDTLVGGASNAITSIAPGTAGFVLTSNGAGADPSYQTIGSGSGAVIQLNGDTGSATPTAGVITLNANSNCGKTVLFNGSGSTVSLKITDASANIIMGALAGSGTISGSNNQCVGTLCLSALTSGSRNNGFGFESLRDITTGTDNAGFGDIALQQVTGSRNSALGSSALQSIVGGSDNIGIGTFAGLLFSGSESSNIVIGSFGTNGESNAIHIGTQGSGSAQQNKCFIAGIAGVTTTNTNIVTINTSTGQLGAMSGTGGGLTWVDVTGATQTVAVGTGYLSDRAGAVTFTLPASATLGDVFRIAGVQGSWTLAQNANQQVKIGSSATTVGVGGSLASTNAGDCIECVATNTSASTVWRVMSSMGNITVV